MQLYTAWGVTQTHEHIHEQMKEDTLHLRHVNFDNSLLGLFTVQLIILQIFTGKLLFVGLSRVCNSTFADSGLSFFQFAFDLRIFSRVEDFNWVHG